jgi:hypothetical protein
VTIPASADLWRRRDRLAARVPLVRRMCGETAAARIESAIEAIDIVLTALDRLAVPSAVARAQLH